MLSLSATSSLMSCQPRLRSVFSQIDLTDDYCDNDDKINDVLEKGLFVRKMMSLAIRPCPLRAAHSLTDLRKAIHALSEHLAAEFAYGNSPDIIFERYMKVFLFSYLIFNKNCKFRSNRTTPNSIRRSR